MTPLERPVWWRAIPSSASRTTSRRLRPARSSARAVASPRMPPPTDDRDVGGTSPLRHQASVYSGPEPPSGGVSRPPLAVIAPHWTQFDGVTFTVTVPSPSYSPTSYTWAGHIHAHISARSRGTARLDSKMVRLVVPGAVAGGEDGRELVERERAVGRRIARARRVRSSGSEAFGSVS